MNMTSVLVILIHLLVHREKEMRKLFLLLFSLSIIVNIGYSQGKWKYNPFTRHRDYYVEGLSLGAAASGDIIYHNGTIWTRLAKGDNDQVLTLAAGLPSWAAAGEADAFTVKVDAAATAGYFGVAGGDGIFRFTANQFTMVDGGNFVTLSLADHATARTALGLQISTDVQAYDADLTTYAGITPSANIQTFLANASFAAMMADLSGTATGAFAWNAQNLTGIGTIGSGNIISTGTGEFQGASVTVGDADTAGALVLSDGSDHNITIDVPAIAGSWALTLPTVDGGAGEFLQTDGAGNTTWAAESAADAFTLKVDVGATADYFGVAGGDGLFRFTADHFTMADGGNFVTLSLADHATARTALGLNIGEDVVAWDADLDTYAGITPSANVQTLLGAATYAAFKTSLSLNNVENTALSGWAGTNNIVTVGTIGTGAWNADTIPVNKGGTNMTSYTIGDVLYASTAGILSGLADVAVNQVLVSGGVGVAPAYSGTPTVASVTTTGAGTIGTDLEVNEAFTFDAFQTATGDGDTTIDWGLGNNMYFTFGAQNEIIRFTAPPGSAVVRMIIKQDGTGSRTINWANVANILWPGNVEPTLSTTAAYVDIVVFLYDGTSWFGLFNGDFR